MSKTIEIEPIGYVGNSRETPGDDYWGSIESRIVLVDKYTEEAVAGIEQFSHIEVLYFFHGVGKDEIIMGSEHPRENGQYPRTGIFAQRKRARPNRIGTTIVELLRREGKTLYVKNLDAIHGTPVIDIKPVFNEFLPAGKVIQPTWVNEIMQHYWN